jgi:hypothetical protein
MMHGPEKSDPVIVATKLANKAERSAAEPVERRAGTKGNASQQSTSRTQSRTSVSQALEHTESRKRKEEGEVHRALPPHQHRALGGGVLRTFAERLATQTDHPSSLAERPFCRYSPKVGAVCGKAARTVLCGGRAMKRASLPRRRNLLRGTLVVIGGVACLSTGQATSV